MRPFDILDIDIFGESHSPEIGATVTGLPSGETFDTAEVAAPAARRSFSARAASSAEPGSSISRALPPILKEQRSSIGSYSRSSSPGRAAFRSFTRAE